MYKIKKKAPTSKPPILYNIIEDYTEFDAPGDVTVCAMTQPEDEAAHATSIGGTSTAGRALTGV